MQNLTLEDKMRIYSVPNAGYKLSLFYRDLLGGDRIYEKPESGESYGCGFRTGGEAMNGRGEHVRHRVSLVLELWDDFTDRPISDPSIVITASGLIRPLRKEDGFYVFVNCPMPVHVEIRSERYETEKFDAGMQDGKAVILKKDCGREKNYPLPAGTTCVTGCAEPGTVIEVAAGGEQRPVAAFFRLPFRKSFLKVWSFLTRTKKQLEGRRFFILDKDEKNGEFFEVKQQESRSGKIVLEKALKHSYKKAGTKIYECSMARADRDGTYDSVKDQSKG